jgi:hypothetical protein
MRIRVSLLASCFLLSASTAHAEWNVGLGGDHFGWTEHVSPIKVKENGLLLALRLGLSQPLGDRVRAAYRGRVYVGEVAYDGSMLYQPTVPVTATTHIGGSTHRAQLAYLFANDISAVAGVDLDLWRRSLSSDQMEDYRIWSARIGAEHDYSESVPWHVATGVKFTLSTHENAHFQQLGFDENPSLEPGGSVTPYLDLGYGFASHWALVGSVDGYTFGASKQVYLSQGSNSGYFFQPASDLWVLGVRVEYR